MERYIILALGRDRSRPQFNMAAFPDRGAKFHTSYIWQGHHELLYVTHPGVLPHLSQASGHGSGPAWYSKTEAACS